MILYGMLSLCRMIFGAVVDLFRPRAALEAEILVLRQQIVVLRRGKPWVRFSVLDRMVLERISAGLNRDSPEDLDRRIWWH